MATISRAITLILRTSTFFAKNARQRAGAGAG